MLGSNPSAVSGTKTEAECSFTPLVFLLPPFWYTRAKSRGSGGWPPDKSPHYKIRIPPFPRRGVWLTCDLSLKM